VDAVEHEWLGEIVPVRDVEEARRLVAERVTLPQGYAITWSRQYEAMQRVRARLATVIPITLACIVLLIYVNTGSAAKTLMVMLAVPFSAIGAVWFIYLLGYNMSVGVWVGLIALVGEAGKRLHTGRSRNEQVAVDVRLWLREPRSGEDPPGGWRRVWGDPVPREPRLFSWPDSLLDHGLVLIDNDAWVGASSRVPGSEPGAVSRRTASVSSRCRSATSSRSAARASVCHRSARDSAATRSLNQSSLSRSASVKCTRATSSTWCGGSAHARGRGRTREQCSRPSAGISATNGTTGPALDTALRT